MYFIYDGVSSADYGITVRNVGYNIVPPNQTITKSIPGKLGRHYFRSEIEHDTITFACQINEGNYQTIFATAENIAKWLSPTLGQRQLSLSPKPDRYADAVITGTVPIQQILLVGKFTLEFMIPSGVWYSDPETWTTGPLIVNGAHPVPCIIEGEATSELSFFEIEIAGQTIKLNQTINPGDEIFIDTDRRMITVNGVSAVPRLDFDSRWIQLPPGEHTVTSNLPVTITYREYWGSIDMHFIIPELVV